jgi:hypothetical protein
MFAVVTVLRQVAARLSRVLRRSGSTTSARHPFHKSRMVRGTSACRALPATVQPESRPPKTPLAMSASGTEDSTVVSSSFEGHPPSDPSTPSTAAFVDDPFMNLNSDVMRDATFYRLTDYVEISVSPSFVGG